MNHRVVDELLVALPFKSLAATIFDVYIVVEATELRTVYMCMHVLTNSGSNFNLLLI